MMRKLVILIFILVLIGGTTAVILHYSKSKPRHQQPTSLPVASTATMPASQPTTRRAAKVKYPTYMEVVRTANPAVAATQPLDYPVDLADAAHLVFHDPTYLDNIGNLWITRKDGQPTAKALMAPAEDEEHIIQDRPVFVHWWTLDSGKWAAAVVLRDGKGGFDLVTKAATRHLADRKPYHWNSAYSIQGKIVVCTDVGVSVFEIEPQIQEHYHVLPGCNATTNRPSTMLDTRGVMAWAPWEKNKAGSNGVSRFVDGMWTDLPAKEWPQRPIHLSMLLDGSVLRMAAGVPTSTAPAEGVEEAAPGDQFPDQIHLSIGEIEPPNYDQKRLAELISQLSNSDSDVRQAAFDELSRYGPAIAPTLEKSSDDQLPAARTRIQQLLRNKITPALNGLAVVDSRLQVVRRCLDGTVIFYAPAGVQIPNEHDEPEILNPAWLAMRANGRLDHPLSAALVKDQNPDTSTVLSMHDDWIIMDDAGPRRLVGSSFEPLLAENEKQFSEVVGMGTRHRWVFREQRENGDTLVIDPGVADPTPRLPAWVILVDKGTAGWDNAQFPAVSRGEPGGDWELNGDGWKGLEKNEKVWTELPASPQPVEFKATTMPMASTQPSTQPTTTPRLENAILSTADGTQYANGKTALVVQRKDGHKIEWPLPASAIGTADPVLIQTSDGLLFLFNEPGRLLRIRPAPVASDAEPFKLEATFTKDIPNAEHLTRIWLDPAGRIDFISDENILTVTFPSGVIPKEISRMMLDEKH